MRVRVPFPVTASWLAALLLCTWNAIAGAAECNGLFTGLPDTCSSLPANCYSGGPTVAAGYTCADYRDGEYTHVGCCVVECYEFATFGSGCGYPAPHCHTCHATGDVLTELACHCLDLNEPCSETCQGAFSCSQGPDPPP